MKTIKIKSWKAVAIIAVGVAMESVLEVGALKDARHSLESHQIISSRTPPHPEIRSDPSEPFSLKPMDLMKIPESAAIGITVATLLKIILKLLIFKLIVKFMAFICVMLYFPKFMATPTTPSFTKPMPPAVVKPPTMTKPPTTAMPTSTESPAYSNVYKHPFVQVFTDSGELIPFTDSVESEDYYRKVKRIAAQPRVCSGNDWSCRSKNSVNKKLPKKKH